METDTTLTPNDLDSIGIKQDQHGRLCVSLGIVKASGRIREELGDVVELAESIRDRGLIHPIVVDEAFNLIAGGRRYTAYTLLNSNSVQCVEPTLFDCIPFNFLKNLSKTEQRLLEIEENTRRKEMTWQEKVLGICDYHRLSYRQALAEGDTWTQEQTGKLLGVIQSDVSNAIRLAKELHDRESPLWKLDSAFEATKFLIQRALDAAAMRQKQLITAKRESFTNQMLQSTPQAVVRVLSTPVSAGGPVDPQAKIVKEVVSKEDISRFFIHGNCLQRLYELKKETVINHIITDPPYAIDMDNLVQDSVARVAETHEVEPNKELLRDFLKAAFDTIAEDGFLCMWYDLDMHQSLLDWGRDIGWKPCRWPVTWCKTSSCQNKSAQYNVTKATEHLMFMRRSTSSIIKKKQAKNWFWADAIGSATHPFVKPDMCWRYPLETVSLENQTVVDPFCGEGSMIRVAFVMSRIVFGVECDEKHIAHGIQWLHGELNQTVDEGMITDESKIPF